MTRTIYKARIHANGVITTGYEPNTLPLRIDALEQLIRKAEERLQELEYWVDDITLKYTDLPKLPGCYQGGTPVVGCTSTRRSPSIEERRCTPSVQVVEPIYEVIDLTSDCE